MNQTKAQLAAKVEENELLILKIVETSNKSVSLEKELIDCQKQLVQARDECESKSSQLQDLTCNMEKSLQQVKEQKVKEVKELKLQIKNQKEDTETTKVALKARAHEVTSLQVAVIAYALLTVIKQLLWIIKMDFLFFSSTGKFEAAKVGQ